MKHPPADLGNKPTFQFTWSVEAVDSFLSNVGSYNPIRSSDYTSELFVFTDGLSSQNSLEMDSALTCLSILSETREGFARPVYLDGDSSVVNDLWSLPAGLARTGILVAFAHSRPYTVQGFDGLTL